MGCWSRLRIKRPSAMARPSCSFLPSTLRQKFAIWEKIVHLRDITRLLQRRYDSAAGKNEKPIALFGLNRLNLCLRRNFIRLPVAAAPVEQERRCRPDELSGWLLAQKAQRLAQGLGDGRVAKRRCMVLFREFQAIGLQRQRQVQPTGLGSPQQSVEGNLPDRRLNQIGAAHHLRDAAIGIIDHHGQVIGEQAIAPFEDKILFRQRLGHLNVAESLIVKAIHWVAHAQAHAALFGGQPQGTTVAIVEAAEALNAGPAAVAVIGQTAAMKFIEYRLIAGMAPDLVYHGFIPLQAVGLWGAEDAIGGARDFARRIQILDAYQPTTLLAAGLQITADGGDQGAKMQGSGGGRGKTSPIGTAAHRFI